MYLEYIFGTKHLVYTICTQTHLCPPLCADPQEGITSAEKAVDVARKTLQMEQVEHREVTQELQALLEKAMDLGHKSMVSGNLCGKAY